jgi:hypothetical protein
VEEILKLCQVLGAQGSLRRAMAKMPPDERKTDHLSVGQIGIYMDIYCTFTVAFRKIKNP